MKGSCMRRQPYRSQKIQDEKRGVLVLEAYFEDRSTEGGVKRRH